MAEKDKCATFKILADVAFAISVRLMWLFAVLSPINVDVIAVSQKIRNYSSAPSPGFFCYLPFGDSV